MRRMTEQRAADDASQGASQRALPRPDNVSRVFWEGTTRGELLVQRCPSCGHHQFFPRALCMACAAEPEWVRASGRGTLHTYTIIQQNRTPPFDALSPYVVGIVELEEGPRMMTNVIGCDPSEVRVGMPLRVDLVTAAPDVALPFWRPAPDDRAGPAPAERTPDGLR
jgi:uncharacterized protein